MTKQNTDHAQVMVPPPLVFLGYLIGAMILNWIVPFPAPWTFILRLVGGFAIIGGILFALGMVESSILSIFGLLIILIAAVTNKK